MLKVIIKGTNREIAAVPEHLEGRFKQWLAGTLRPGYNIYFTRAQGQDIPHLTNNRTKGYNRKQLRVATK